MKTLENYFFIGTILFPRNKCILTVIFDLQDVESMSTTSVNINRPSRITTRYFYKTVFSRILPLKSKIHINVIPSPGFKLVVLIDFLDDSWVFLNVFLNGHNIKRVHLCSKSKIMKIKNITSHDQSSAASDLDHCQFKMPGKCKFLNKWLEQPQYHAWLRNSPDIHKAHCKSCNKSFDISSLGESALQSHMKGIFISLFLPCVKGSERGS